MPSISNLVVDLPVMNSFCVSTTGRLKFGVYIMTLSCIFYIRWLHLLLMLFHMTAWECMARFWSTLCTTTWHCWELGEYSWCRPNLSVLCSMIRTVSKYPIPFISTIAMFMPADWEPHLVVDSGKLQCVLVWPDPSNLVVKSLLQRVVGMCVTC